MVSSGPEVLFPYGESEEEIVLHCEKLNSDVGQRAAIRAPLEMKGRGWEGGREDREGEGKGQLNLSGLRIVWAGQ